VALHFPFATQIVDLYHAREHLANLGKAVYGPTNTQAKQWAAACSQQLDAGEVETVIRSMKRIRTREHQARKEIRKAITTFKPTRNGCATQSFADRVCLSAPALPKPAARR
jgi:hypothetical protein